MGPVERDPASFRDPGSTVFISNGRVFRGLSSEAGRDWERASSAGFLDQLTSEGKVVATKRVPCEELPGRSWQVVLEHEAVPFLSYPFEWPFGMLRDAAILHLEVLLRALADDITTKDGSAYNVQWRGSSPIFIDMASFVPAGAGPWLGYRQFCETFLTSLLLQACRGVDFQPWLRGHLEGIPLAATRRLLTLRDLARPGVLRHVFLHSLLQERTKTSASATKAALEEAGFDRKITTASAAGLLRLVESLSWTPAATPWTSYAQANSYSSEDKARKARFVESALQHHLALVLDLGCNDGNYSRIAARSADYVVAVDGDHLVVENFYRSLAAERNSQILTLVMDMTNPTPALGWRGERRSFQDRARPDLVLCLALVHHLTIAGNVPLLEVVDWLRSFNARVVAEFVPPSDPLVQQMLADKPAGHHEYRTEYFESLLSARFSLLDSEELTGGRRLYELAPR